MDEAGAAAPKISSRRRRWNRIKRLIKFMVLIGLIDIGVAYNYHRKQQHYYYVPEASKPDSAKFEAAGMMFIDVKTVDGLTLRGWYKRPADPSKPVVILFHSDGVNIGSRIFKAQEFIKAGYGFLLAEYRGYGGNPGEPSEKALYADARAYIQWIQIQGIPSRRIVVYGESLGTGVAVQMAMEQPSIRALVLEAPYATLVSVDVPDFIWMPPWWVAGNEYDNLAKMEKIRIPVLIVVGDKDDLVPNEQGRRLFALTKTEKALEVIAGGGHADLYNFGAGAKIISFLENVKH